MSIRRRMKVVEQTLRHHNSDISLGEGARRSTPFRGLCLCFLDVLFHYLSWSHLKKALERNLSLETKLIFYRNLGLKLSHRWNVEWFISLKIYFFVFSNQLHVPIAIYPQIFGKLLSLVLVTVI